MKIKKLKRVWSFALAGIMALTLGLFSTNLPAQAQDGTEGNPANVKVIKTLRIAKEGITVPTVTFQFDFTPLAFNNQANSEASVPAISSQTISYGTSDQRDVDGNGDAIDTITKEVDSVLSIGNYTSAGLYTYTVKEVAPTAGYEEIEKGVLTYSQEEYTLYVLVSNGSNGLYFSEVSTALTGSNVKGDNLEFTNTFTKEGGNDTDTDALTIQKIMNDTNGSQTKQFAFDLTVVFPSTATDNTTYIGTKSDGTTVNVTVGAASTSVSFTLAHNETMIFEDLPAGSYYTLTEAADTEYTPSYNVVANDVVFSATGALNTPLSTGEMLIGERVNTATYTNVFGGDIRTGILVNNLPYILLIAAAILGLVAFVAVKRRREMR